MKLKSLKLSPKRPLTPNNQNTNLESNKQKVISNPKLRDNLSKAKICFKHRTVTEAKTSEKPSSNRKIRDDFEFIQMRAETAWAKTVWNHDTQQGLLELQQLKFRHAIEK